MIEFDKEKKETMTRKLGLVIALMLAMFVGTTAFAGTPGQNSNANMTSNSGSMTKNTSGRRRHRRTRRRHRRSGRKAGGTKTTGNGNMK